MIENIQTSSDGPTDPIASFQELIVLLPCHALEDFPTYLEETDADGLLSACTALWHPALLHSTRKLPTWCRADVPPLELTERLLIVPPVTEGWLACDFTERAKNERAVVIRGLHSRTEIAAEALLSLVDPAVFDAEMVADFFALGFCRLQVELMTRIIRYTTTIDDTRLSAEVLTAVDAAVAGDKAEANAALQRCFEQLCESRRYFFPVDPHIIDLMLIADTTLGPSLRSELASPVAKNLLVCGKVLEEMAEREPDSIAAIKAGLEQGTVNLVGGEYEEREFPLLPEEVWRDDLLHGIATYERLVGRRPVVYGRRRAGLSPLLPQLLCRTGFQAALHFTLDDGQFPTSPNSKVRWDSADGSVVEAIAQIPLDASRNAPFLDLPRQLGQAMDRDQVATLVFAHWPGMCSRWFDELRRVARYTAALGKFVTLEEYFSETVTATSFATFSPDEYRTPYLQQDFAHSIDNPLSRIATLHREHFANAADRAMELVLTPLGNSVPNLVADPPRPIPALVINPNSFAVPCVVNLSAVGREANMQQPFLNPEGESVSVRVPGMGFAWVSTDAPANKDKRPSKATSSEKTIRNEFCEVVISKTTGGIQSINDYRTRGNRLSQQLALRSPGSARAPGSAWRDADLEAAYSVMVADDVSNVVESGDLMVVTSRGRLVDREGRRYAGFQQVTWLALGDPVVHLQIDLEVDEQPVRDPWNNYYTVRFALPDSSDLTFSRNIGLGQQITEARRIESPLFVDVASSRWRTTILTGGLPYHRRVQSRTLDTLLVVAGESRRRFQLGIGIDVPDPAAAAVALVSPVRMRDDVRPPQVHGESAWLFHLDAKNVLATAWEPTGDAGFRVRLQETSGAAGRVCLRSWQAIATARQTDFFGNTLCELAVEHDKIWVEMKPHEWIQVEAYFL